MSRRIRLSHLTRYGFDRKVKLGPHIVRLKPAPQARARILDYRLTVAPSDHVMTWHTDPFGNAFARLIFADATDRLEVTNLLEAEIDPVNPFGFLIEPTAEKLPFDYAPSLAHDLAPLLAKPAGGGAFAAYVGDLRVDGKPTITFLGELAQRVAEDIRYRTREEEGVFGADETLRHGEGSCRDSAWLLVELLRALGIAARFVSGYLIELAEPTTKSGGGAKDRAELHAWCEAFVPGAGWIGIDGTSGLFAAESHVPLAAASFPAGAGPIEGTVEPCRSVIEHAIAIARLA